MTQQRLMAGRPWRIRLIALFEALKELLALALGFGLVASFGESLSEAAEELVLGLHLDPSKRLPEAFIDAISGVHSGQLWLVIASAVAYSLIRFSEAYGLWRERRWAAWVSALSGAVYLPFEGYELWNGLSWFRVAAALANVAIVTYMAVLLWKSRRSVAKDSHDAPLRLKPKWEPQATTGSGPFCLCDLKMTRPTMTARKTALVTTVGDFVEHLLLVVIGRDVHRLLSFLVILLNSMRARVCEEEGFEAVDQNQFHIGGEVHDHGILLVRGFLHGE